MRVGKNTDQSTAVRDLSFGTLFKIIFFAGILVWAAFTLLVLLMGLSAPSTVKINGRAAETASDVLMIVPIGLVIGIVFSAIGASLGAVLLKVFGDYLPLGAIRTSF